MRAHLYRPLQDSAGNLQRGATVRVYQPGTSVLIGEDLFVSDDETNFETYTQPVSCPTGFVSIYFGAPRRVRLGVVPFGGGTETFFDDIDAFVPQIRAQDVSINLSQMNAREMRSAIYEILTNKYGPDNPPPSSSSTASGVYNQPYGLVGETNVQKAINRLVDYKYGPDVPEAFRLHADNTNLTLEPYDKVVFCSGTPVTVTLPALGDDVPPPPPPPADSDGDGIPDYEDPDYVPPPDTTFNDTDPMGDHDGDGVLNYQDPDWTPPPPEEPPPPPVFKRRDVGRQFVIKNLNANLLTVAAGPNAVGGATLIDGEATRTLAQYDVLTVVWTGTTWGVI